LYFIRSKLLILYLALGGEHPDIDITENLLQHEGILALLATKPDIYEWKTLSEADFLAIMRDCNYKCQNKLIKAPKKV
jgi:hypothetical protein